MANVPYGTKWIRDLVPNVSWDNNTQSVKMPDGSVLPKSMYTIVDSKAYVRPDDVSKYISGPNQNTGLPPVQTSNTAPVGTTPIRNLVPDVTWGAQDQSITLPTGEVLPRNMYTLVNGQSYVNPYSLAGYYTPKPLTTEEYQSYYDQARNVFQPSIDRQYERINNLISVLQDKLNANIQSIESQGDIARGNLQRQETADSEKLRNQSIARGTYTSGVADYQQQQMAGDYAGRYSDLESSVASAIAGANADMSGTMADLSYQASTVEDQFMDRIVNLVNSLVGNEIDSRSATYNHIVGTSGALQSQNREDLQAAIARTEMFGRVVSDADAKLLGVPTGTPSYQAVANTQALAARGTGGSTGGSPTTQGALPGMTTDEARQWSAAMDLWAVTGKAPNDPLLQKYGIKAGTPYTEEGRYIASQASKDNQWANILKSSYKGSYSSFDLQVAAELMTENNGNANAAINRAKTQQAKIQESGGNYKNVVALLQSHSSYGSGAAVKVPTTTSTSTKAADTYDVKRNINNIRRR